MNRSVRVLALAFAVLACCRSGQLPGARALADEPKSPVLRATLKGHSPWLLSVAFSPDGKTLAVASWERGTRLWDVAAGKEAGAVDGHSTAAFSPDGKTLALGGKVWSVKLWDVATRKDRSALEWHRAQVSCVAFSPDGKMLASASRDRTFKLWDVRPEARKD